MLLRRGLVEWTVAVLHARRFKSGRSRSVLEVRYEELVNNPRATVGAVARFLGLFDGVVGVAGVEGGEAGGDGDNRLLQFAADTVRPTEKKKRTTKVGEGEGEGEGEEGKEDGIEGAGGNGQGDDDDTIEALMHPITRDLMVALKYMTRTETTRADEDGQVDEAAKRIAELKKQLSVQLGSGGGGGDDRREGEEYDMMLGL